MAISLGIFPDHLQFSITTPFIKKGGNMNITHYRPILPHSFSKIFEEVMYPRLGEHLNINKILVQKQCGFRKNLAREASISI
jgi:hypothetical protein